MTWMPIWSKVSKVLIAPVIIPALSYGLFSYIVSGDNVYDNVKEDKEEMIRWSNSLGNPNHPNFNPFILRNK